jgi:predicted nucleic acid-binding protein
MIAYLDSSAIVRSYVNDEADRGIARSLFDDPTVSTISGSWTRVEVTGALVRAARAGRGSLDDLLGRFERDQTPARGPLLLVDVEQAEVEGLALEIVRRWGIRAMDAWQLACATIAFDALADVGEERAFVTHDAEQARVASQLGFTVL